MIGCEDRLRNDLYCVEWGVKLYSNQPTASLSFGDGAGNTVEENYRTFSKCASYYQQADVGSKTALTPKIHQFPAGVLANAGCPENGRKTSGTHTRTHTPV